MKWQWTLKLRQEYLPYCGSSNQRQITEITLAEETVYKKWSYQPRSEILDDNYKLGNGWGKVLNFFVSEIK